LGFTLGLLSKHRGVKNPGKWKNSNGLGSKGKPGDLGAELDSTGDFEAIEISGERIALAWIGRSLERQLCRWHGGRKKRKA